MLTIDDIHEMQEIDKKFLSSPVTGKHLKEWKIALNEYKNKSGLRDSEITMLARSWKLPYHKVQDLIRKYCGGAHAD